MNDYSIRSWGCCMTLPENLVFDWLWAFFSVLAIESSLNDLLTSWCRLSLMSLGLDFPSTLSSRLLLNSNWLCCFRADAGPAGQEGNGGSSRRERLWGPKRQIPTSQRIPIWWRRRVRLPEAYREKGNNVTERDYHRSQLISGQPLLFLFWAIADAVHLGIMGKHLMSSSRPWECVALSGFLAYMIPETVMWKGFFCHKEEDTACGRLFSEKDVWVDMQGW